MLSDSTAALFFSMLNPARGCLSFFSTQRVLQLCTSLTSHSLPPKSTFDAFKPIENAPTS